MASIITHAVIPISMGLTFWQKKIPFKLILLGILFSILPDLDVISFKFGIPYSSPLGHRGLSHSIIFAFVFSLITSLFLRNQFHIKSRIIFVFLFTSMLSHGILDAMTNGGEGVGFFVPYNNERFFFSYRPILVSPIGIKNFFTNHGLMVFLSELNFIWLPCLIWLIFIIPIIKVYDRFKDLNK